MTESEAQHWVRGSVGQQAYKRLARYVEILLTESERQNLIAPSTKGDVWSRHIVDSLQLLRLAPKQGGCWVDVGSGAGLPGLVIALASEWQVTLVEPRRLRVGFLEQCVASLGLRSQVAIVGKPIEKVAEPVASVISARAVSSLPKLLEASHHLSTKITTWLLPKGATAQTEVESLGTTWQGRFHVEQSIVDPTSGIIVAIGVSRR